MTRTKRLVLGLAVAGLMGTVVAAPTSAQEAAKPGSDKLAGMWEGPYVTDGPSGTMSLKVEKESSAWTVALELGGDVPPPGAPSDVAANGNVLTWSQVFGEFDVAFKATLSDDGAQITGTLEASQGGSYVGGGSFTLTKKASGM